MATRIRSACNQSGCCKGAVAGGLISSDVSKLGEGGRGTVHRASDTQQQSLSRHHGPPRHSRGMRRGQSFDQVLPSLKPSERRGLLIASSNA